MRMVDKTKRKERRELGHTALSAAHMVIYPDKPGGDDMVKVRLQGTKEDMEWLFHLTPKEYLDLRTTDG